MKRYFFIVCCLLFSLGIYFARLNFVRVTNLALNGLSTQSDVFYLMDQSEEDWLHFVGYNNKSPVFYKYSSQQKLYNIKQFSQDSIFLQPLRDSKYGINNEMHLLWVDEDMEIYTMRKDNSEHDENLIITTENGTETIYYMFDSFYDYDVRPVVFTADRKSLLLVKPTRYQDENLGWYYGNILKVDLTKKPLVAEEFIKGYLLKERVLRPAKVKVVMPEK